MKRSTQRILTTHVGSLIRPPELLEFFAAKQKGAFYDKWSYEKCLKESVAAIVKTLEPTLAGQQTAVKGRHSENLQAYELYLKGRRLWDQRMESTLRAGLECFRAAIALELLKSHGFTRLRHLAGDFTAWTAEGRPVEDEVVIPTVPH